jgi:DNA (cytosine-5)-methyltransferase 1
MWDVVRFAEQKLLKGRPYKAIVVENVVDAFKWGYDDDGGLFNAWLQAMRALGYEHEIVWLNSMFCPPTPQSRDRMYVVFWRKGIRRPNLRVEPPPGARTASAIVDGRRRGRSPGARVWGRYGAQYLYGCPDCHGVVLPGAFPAASIIDWELPRADRRAQAAAREEHARADPPRPRAPRARAVRDPAHPRRRPRPLTLPLVTLTQRHDPAMVLPVAGNTYENARPATAPRRPSATRSRPSTARSTARSSSRRWATSPRATPTRSRPVADDHDAGRASSRTGSAQHAARRRDEPVHTAFDGRPRRALANAPEARPRAASEPLHRC